MSKYFPVSEETQFGHMEYDQPARYTQLKMTAAKERLRKSTTSSHICMSLTKTIGKHTRYSDQTGNFPYISSRGNRSIMVIHHFNSNSFWLEPLKNQKEGLLIVAQTRILEQMCRKGIVPKHQILDNQCKGLMKLAIESTKLADGSTSKMMYELIPPEDHCRNLCKISIETFKDHFIGVINECAKKIPMHLWGQLLPQVEQHNYY